MTSPSCHFLKTTLFVQPADFGVDNRDAAAFRRGERVIHLVDEVRYLFIGDDFRRRTLQIEADGDVNIFRYHSYNTYLRNSAML